MTVESDLPHIEEMYIGRSQFVFAFARAGNDLEKVIHAPPGRWASVNSQPQDVWTQSEQQDDKILSSRPVFS